MCENQSNYLQENQSACVYIVEHALDLRMPGSSLLLKGVRISAHDSQCAPRPRNEIMRKA